MSNLNIFICHSSNDKPEVRNLYKRLRSDGLDPWLDEERLLPGQDWNLEIKKAVKNSHVVLVCLSTGSINKRGFIQKEIKYALDVADEQPEGSIFLIPLKLEECEVPERLRMWQWVNYFDNQDYERLLKALNARALELGLDRDINVILSLLDLNLNITYAINPRAMVGEEMERILNEFKLPRVDKMEFPIEYRIYSKHLGRTLSASLTFSENGIPQGDRLYIARLEIAG